MIRTQIQFTPAQLRQLRAAARRDGVSVAEFVRGAVDRALESAEPQRARQWQQLLGTAGAFRDREGRAEVSARHDDFLDEAFAP